MKTKVTETSKEYFISEELSYHKCGDYSLCDNYKLICRTFWVKFWILPWLPLFRKALNIRVPGNVLSCFAFGGTSTYPEKHWTPSLRKVNS